MFRPRLYCNFLSTCFYSISVGIFLMCRRNSDTKRVAHLNLLQLTCDDECASSVAFLSSLIHCQTCSACKNQYLATGTGFGPYNKHLSHYCSAIYLSSFLITVHHHSKCWREKRQHILAFCFCFLSFNFFLVAVNSNFSKQVFAKEIAQKPYYKLTTAPNIKINKQS